MQGSGSWFLLASLVSLACGGRSALELSPNDSEGGARSFGPSSAGGSLALAGSPNRGTAPNSGGASGTDANPSAGTSARSRGGRGSAGEGAVTPRLFASSVSAGTDMTCATVRGGRVWCWGSNDRGQLGDGTTRTSAVPVQVAYIDDALTVTAGGTWTSGGMGAGLSAFACAWLRDETLDCWGNEFGWLAGDTFSGSSPVPQPVIGAARVTSIAAGNWHLCTLSSGAVSCWGWNRGQLGQAESSTGDPPEPVRVPGITDAVAISAHGSDFTCAVLADASVECWGSEWGPSGLSDNPTPVTIPGVLASASGLAVGFTHACAVSTAGSPVQCWGSNSHGELGDGTANASSTPVTVQGLGGLVTGLAAGQQHTCAVLSDGYVQCWGGGVLGNGTVVNSPLPVTVNGITDAVQVSAGYLHTCARTTAGRILCWGDNGYGQLGNGDTTGATSPTPIAVTGF